MVYSSRSTLFKTTKKRIHYTKQIQWKSLCVLIDGKFNIQFGDKLCKLTNQGDFAYWYPNLPHTNYTDIKSTLFTIRWRD